MDEMELDQTPGQQPEDPFKGDAAVTAEQPEQPVQSEQPVQTETAVQTEAVTAETQSQPAAEAEAKPKWIKIVEIVTIVCIAAAGVLSALFMCLLSIKSFGSNMMLADIGRNLNAVTEKIVKAEGSFVGLNDEVAQLFVNLYAMLAMLGGIIAGCIFGIILIVKIINKYALKKQVAFEKTAITAVLFFFSFAIILLSLVISYQTLGSEKMSIEYGDSTLAGLIICGILFAAYFIGKIAVNYKSYLGDKTKLINGCMNLGWAIVAMIVLAVLSCAPVCAVATQSGVKLTMGTGFNQICSDVMGDIVGLGDNIPDDVMGTLATQFALSGLGIILQIWFIFQSGKSLHGAMRGTVAADKAVKLGTQIWRLVFAVLYLIVCALLTKEQIKNLPYLSMSLAAPVVILVFSIIGLVLAIINKIIVKEKSNKQEI